MKDQFFDVCVQLCVLGYLLESEDKQHCFKLVNNLLTDSKFEEWTSELCLEEIEHTSWLFINHYGSDLISEVKVTLPKAMKTLLSNIKRLQITNKLELAKMHHEATKSTFHSTQCLFDEILRQQKKELYKLEWENLK